MKALRLLAIVLALAALTKPANAADWLIFGVDDHRAVRTIVERGNCAHFWMVNPEEGALNAQALQSLYVDRALLPAPLAMGCKDGYKPKFSIVVDLQRALVWNASYQTATRVTLSRVALPSYTSYLKNADIKAEYLANTLENAAPGTLAKCGESCAGYHFSILSGMFPNLLANLQQYVSRDRAKFLAGVVDAMLTGTGEIANNQDGAIGKHCNVARPTLTFNDGRWILHCSGSVEVDLTPPVGVLELPKACGTVSFDGATSLDQSTAIYPERVPDVPSFRSNSCSPEQGGYTQTQRVGSDVDAISEAPRGTCLSRGQLEALVQIQATTRGKFSTSGPIAMSVELSLNKRLSGWVNFALAPQLDPSQAICTQIQKDAEGHIQSWKCTPGAGASRLDTSDLEPWFHLVSPIRVCSP